MAKVENKATGRPIDPEKVANAQKALVLAGGNVPKAARLCNTQARTIYSYIDKGLIDPTVKLEAGENLATLDALTGLTRDRHESMAKDMLSVAEQAMSQAEIALPDATAQQAATVMGIMVQNSRLLSGEATQRVDLNVTNALEPLRRLGLIVDPEEVIEAEVVE